MKLANIPYKVRVNGSIVEETTNEKGVVNNEILFRVVYSDNMIEHALSVAMFEWLAQEMKIEVSTHGPSPSAKVDFDTLYLWNLAWSATGASEREATGKMGRFFGRWRAKTAMGDTLVELLKHLDLQPSFRPRSEAEDKYARNPY